MKGPFFHVLTLCLLLGSNRLAAELRFDPPQSLGSYDLQGASYIGSDFILDLDKNGSPDLVAEKNDSGQLYFYYDIFENVDKAAQPDQILQLEGKFGTDDFRPIPDGFLKRQFQFADLDGDGQKDLIVINTAVFGWYRNLGDRNFGAFRLFRAADRPYFHLVKPLDVDSDGDLDIITSEPGEGQPHENLIWPNKGDGTFEKPLPFQSQGYALRNVEVKDNKWLVSARTAGVVYQKSGADLQMLALFAYPSYDLVVYVNNIRQIDFNRDGKADILVTYESDQYFIRSSINLGNHRYQAEEWFDTPETLWGSGKIIEVTDFDGDGEDEFVIQQGSSQFHFHAWRETEWKVNLTVETDKDQRTTQFSDLDGDGKLDMLTVHRRDHFDRNQVVWRRNSSNSN